MKIVFGTFTLDVDSRQLTTADGERHLSRKAFDLLVALAVARPAVMTKAELQQRLWPATFVDEANLANLIAEIRDALGDNARRPAFIRTVHRVGYAFCAKAEAIRSTIGADAPARQRCWLEWGARRFELSLGDHIVGRDADVTVSIDDGTVSRRHASLTVTSEGVMLQDLGSKNGTFHNGARVSTPVGLNDGDALSFGSAVLTFHLSTFGSTQTRAIDSSPSHHH